MPMENTILNTVKTMHTGWDVSAEEDPTFNTELLVFINSAVATLVQNGLGDESGFRITETTEWSEIIPEGQNLENVKNFVYLKARLQFDPPSSPSILQSFKAEADELLWRINTEIDNRREV